MVDLYTGTVPNLTQSQPDFDENTQGILDYIAGLAPQLNEWVGAYVQDTTSASTTSNTIGTGSKIFTVEAGKGYKVNMTLRASATSGNFMDGVVTSYSGTSLTINFTTFTGSGTFSDWNIFLTISGGATLASNTFTGDQFVPDEAYDASGWNGNLSVPTKNAVRDIIETIIASIPALSTKSESEAGTNNTKIITPLRLREALRATGSAPVYAARAWVNFNGTGATGAKTPRASANIASVIKNSTGNYTITFTDAMPSANYSFSVEAMSSTGYLSSGRIPSAPTTSSFTYVSTDGAGSATDAEYISIVFFDAQD